MALSMLYNCTSMQSKNVNNLNDQLEQVETVEDQFTMSRKTNSFYHIQFQSLQADTWKHATHLTLE